MEEERPPGVSATAVS